MTTMIKKTICTLLGILLFNLSFGQNQQQYSELTKKALVLYENKEYLKSGQKYSDAFKSFGNRGWLNDRYIAACSWALANEIDSAFSQLLKVVKNSNFIFEDYVTNNSV